MDNSNSKKTKILGIPILKVEKLENTKKVYLFNYIPLLKKRYSRWKKKYYLFNFLYIYSKPNDTLISSTFYERDTLTREKNTLIGEKNTLIGEKNTLIGERNTLIEEKNTLIREKNTLIADEYRKSYSQCAEDRCMNFILFYFTNVDVTNLIYLDIGANHPVNSNNTYYFYKKNATGVLIEPNKTLANLCLETRPNDIVIDAGIKFDEQDEATYYELSTNGLNTFSKESLDYAISMGRLLTPRPVKLYPIMDIITEHLSNKKIHIVSIDAEGFSFEILKTFDFSKTRPVLICIESEKESFKYGDKHEVIDFMVANDYMLMADTSINFIFLAKEEYVKNKYC